MKHDLRPLDGPFGREVVGLDLSADHDAEMQRQLNDWFVAHKVLLFRGQHLDDDQLRRAASLFGVVRQLPGGFRGQEQVCGVRHLTNIDPDGKPTGRHPDRFGKIWHTDGGILQPPARATLLYSIKAPAAGGDTQFADMCSAFAAFSEPEQQRLKACNVIYDVDLARVMRHGRSVLLRPDLDLRARTRARLKFLRRMLPGRATVNPVVHDCEERGEPAIILGCDAWRICGMGWRKGMRTVDEWNDKSLHNAPKLQHSWQEGDVMVWDNRCLLHRVTDYDIFEEVRVMRQVVIKEHERALAP